MRMFGIQKQAVVNLKPGVKDFIYVSGYDSKCLWAYSFLFFTCLELSMLTRVAYWHRTTTVQRVVNREFLCDFSSVLEHTKLRNSETLFVLFMLYLLDQPICDETDNYFLHHTFASLLWYHCLCCGLPFRLFVPLIWLHGKDNLFVTVYSEYLKLLAVLIHLT
jgi:hypothetical protein